MEDKPIRVVGELMGQHLKPKAADALYEEVVKIPTSHEPGGPAENSFIIVEVSQSGQRKARYIPWIGYADLDFASAEEPGAWKLIEPAQPYDEEVQWRPYG